MSEVTWYEHPFGATNVILYDGYPLLLLPWSMLVIQTWQGE